MARLLPVADGPEVIIELGQGFQEFLPGPAPQFFGNQVFDGYIPEFVLQVEFAGEDKEFAPHIVAPRGLPGGPAR